MYVMGQLLHLHAQHQVAVMQRLGQSNHLSMEFQQERHSMPPILPQMLWNVGLLSIFQNQERRLQPLASHH